MQDKIKLDRSITFGNIVSWLVIIIAGLTGYVTMQSEVKRSTSDIVELKAKDEKQDALLNGQTTDIAVIKVTVQSIDSKIDALRK